MTLLAILWNWELFLKVILPLCVIAGFLAYRRTTDIYKDDGWDYAAMAVGALIFVCSAALTLGSGSHKEVKAELNALELTEEERYYEVKNMGKAPVKWNPSDNRWYVKVGGGRMIGFQTIIDKGMCRACEQFANAIVGDRYIDSVFVYQAKTSDRSYMNDPALYFSKTVDLVFEEAINPAQARFSAD